MDWTSIREGYPPDTGKKPVLWLWKKGGKAFRGGFLAEEPCGPGEDPSARHWFDVAGKEVRDVTHWRYGDSENAPPTAPLF